MTNMSSLAALAGRAEKADFQQDARFACAAQRPTPGSSEPAVATPDPLTEAFADGYAHGARDAQTTAAATLAEEADARTALDLSFSRIDADMADDLRRRLQETVLALCDAALAPLALDEKALAVRVERAVAMLARADDERVIRLNPEDLRLVSPRLPQEWKVTEDTSLPRGALRIETQSGGVEDGPAEWRRAITEALASC